MKTFSPEFNEMYDLLYNNMYYVFDTETTGLRRPAEIVQFALVDLTGKVLIDTLVKPKFAIPAQATAIHGITSEMCKNAPSWDAVKAKFLNIVSGEIVVSYNVVFDRQMMHLSDEAYGLPHTDYKTLSRYYCAMEWYAELYGAWDDYHQSYTWQKLSNAMLQSHLEVSDAHTALGDAQMTAELLKFHLTHNTFFQPPTQYDGGNDVN